jgi:DNA-directed RNA polymerase II subunit RPB2
MGRKEEEAHPIRVALPKVKADIPLFVLFRALGIESDKDIMEFILLDVDQKKNRQFLQFLKYSLDAANDLEVYTKDDAIEYLTKYIASWATY